MLSIDVEGVTYALWLYPYPNMTHNKTRLRRNWRIASTQDDLLSVASQRHAAISPHDSTSHGSTPSPTEPQHSSIDLDRLLRLQERVITNSTASYSSKRSLNVDSPSFTPVGLASGSSNGSIGGRSTTMSSQAANAAPFTPRSMTSGKPIGHVVINLLMIIA